MYFNFQSIVLLSLSSGLVTPATAAGPADVSSANNLYALLKEQKPAERIETFKGLDHFVQKQVFINRINDYRESQPQQLKQKQNDILDKAIQLIQADKPTSPLLDEGAREAFGFKEFKRLLTTLEDPTVPMTTTTTADEGIMEIRGDTDADVASSKPDCTCDTQDDYCDHDKGLYCKGDNLSECDGTPGCCEYSSWGCGSGLFGECTGLCM